VGPVAPGGAPVAAGVIGGALALAVGMTRLPPALPQPASPAARRVATVAATERGSQLIDLSLRESRPAVVANPFCLNRIVGRVEKCVRHPVIVEVGCVLAPSLTHPGREVAIGDKLTQSHRQ
jgi:hypothetical protein